MRRIYACLLELAHAAGRVPLSARRSERWVGGAHGGWPSDAVERWESERDVTRALAHGRADGAVAFELTWTRSAREDRTLWRRTRVHIVTTVTTTDAS